MEGGGAKEMESQERSHWSLAGPFEAQDKLKPGLYICWIAACGRVAVEGTDGKVVKRAKRDSSLRDAAHKKLCAGKSRLAPFGMTVGLVSSKETLGGKPSQG